MLYGQLSNSHNQGTRHACTNKLRLLLLVWLGRLCSPSLYLVELQDGALDLFHVLVGAGLEELRDRKGEDAGGLVGAQHGVGLPCIDITTRTAHSKMCKLVLRAN